MREHAGRLQLSLAPLVALILVATLSIDFLSAYIRHTEAGLGCRDWPACYGQIGESIASVEQPGIARHALTPDPLAKRAHRLLATGLVVMVLLLLHRSRQRGALAGFEAQIPLLMAALLLLLAVIGPASYLKTRPAIAACNLLGGMALAALSWRLLLGLRRSARVVSSVRLRRLTRIALGLLVLQLALGAWVSANFAGLACGGLLDCAAPANAGTDSVPAAFWYFRELALDADGRVPTTAGSVAIHVAHHAGACLAAFALLAAGVQALRERVPRHIVLPVLALLLAQLGLGAFMVSASLPLPLVLAHSTVAALLLLALMRLDYTLQPASPERRS